jgi:hypothetical protein
MILDKEKVLAKHFRFHFSAGTLHVIHHVEGDNL